MIVPLKAWTCEKKKKKTFMKINGEATTSENERMFLRQK